MSIAHVSLTRATRLAFVTLAVTAAAAGSALAGPIGDTGTLRATRQSGYYSGSGGEFTAYSFGSSLSVSGYSSATSNIGPFDPSFQTFCLEYSENAVSPSSFVINSAAVSGGNEAVGGKDPISKGTSWLYSQFALGTLTGYFTGSRSQQASLLQQAIWWLEGEAGNYDSLSNPYYALAVSQFGSKAAAQATAEVGYLGVYVLNNYYWDHGQKKKAQDFLYHVAVPVTTPDGGATLALFGGAMMGLGLLRRRLGA